jgi:hypothetical protein
MKDLYQVLQQKTDLVSQLKSEVEVLRRVERMLAEDSDTVVPNPPFSSVRTTQVTTRPSESESPLRIDQFP